jgi:hypothetical protein
MSYSSTAELAGSSSPDGSLGAAPRCDAVVVLIPNAGRLHQLGPAGDVAAGASRGVAGA